MNIVYIWLAAGVVLALAELHFAGIGLFFAGLGAIITGTFIHFGTIGEENYVAQFITAFASTGIFALLLWKPLQHFRRPSPGYSNIVGEIAVVGSGGLSRQGGEVTWSGTIMKAQLAKDVTADKLDAGAQVIITEVSGATLTVKPKA